MADIGHLGGLQEVEPLDLENYEDNRKSTFQLPQKGLYTLQAPDSFPQAAFGRTKAGSLLVQIDPTIVGPTNAGYNLRFIKISGKTYKRGEKNASQIGDYLRATGFKGLLKSEQDQADAVEQTAGTTYEAHLDWRAYNSKTGFSLEGMDRFPRQENGEPQPWVEDPVEKNPETGKPVRVWARLFIPINGFVAATD